MAKYLRNNNFIKIIGSRLRECRKKKGLTMMELVDLSGIEYNQLSSLNVAWLIPVCLIFKSYQKYLE